MTPTSTLRYSLVVMVGLILLACQPVQPVSMGIEPVVDYDPPLLPEGIAIDTTGNMYVSLANQSELQKITPDGTESILTTLPTGGFGLLGLAVDAPGNVYAALATADAVTNGVYRVIYAVRVIGNELIRINLADTTQSVLAMADDGLDGPASLVFGTGDDNRTYVYITNFTLANTEDPDPGVLKLNVGVAGLPLP